MNNTKAQETAFKIIDNWIKATKKTDDKSFNIDLLNVSVLNATYSIITPKGVLKILKIKEAGGELVINKKTITVL